jgi:hypothetical protein
MAYFILGYFSMKLGTSVDVNLYYAKCTGKHDFTLKKKISASMCQNLKILTGPKIRFKILCACMPEAQT